MTTTHSDRELRCRICGRTFIFSAGEQQYFGRRGFQTPTRCPDCRTGTSRRPRGGPGRRQEEGGASPRPARTWKATCFRCGAATTVPFLPREDALIYCQGCLDEIFGPRRSTPAAGSLAAHPNGGYRVSGD